MIRIWSDVPLVPAACEVLAGEAHFCGPGFGGESFQMWEEAEAALVGPGFPGDAAMLGRAPRLRAVARVGAGYDNIDIAAATALGICVIHTPDAPTIATSEFTIGLMLAVIRRISLADRRLRTEGWIAAPELTGRDLAGSTLGLVGLGRIGRRVAGIARAMEMRVIAFDPLLQPRIARESGVHLTDTLEQLLADADIVSLHVPLAPCTRHMINRERLGMMKPEAVLINASRGPVVDEEALYEALAAGRLLGAGLDVWEDEPLRADCKLLQLPNVVATPHVAANTHKGRQRSNVAAARSLRMALHGERPPGLLNPAVWPACCSR